jgi:branched-chain amino acid transport system substrate-binding protein
VKRSRDVWRRRVLLTAAGAVALAVSVAACSSASGGTTGGDSSKAPIVVGNVSGITGPFDLADESYGAKAFFDRLNKNGGINGAKVDFVIMDDQTNPATSAQDARELIQQQNVVAFVGSGSLVDCAINQNLYTSSDVRSIYAGAAINQCFEQPNVSPVNAGLTTDFILSLNWLATSLHAKNICTINAPSPTLDADWPEIVSGFTKLSGEKLGYSNQTLSANSNYAAIFAKAKQENCDAIASSGTPAQAVPMALARNQQGLSGVPLMFEGAAYTGGLPAALPAGTSDVYSVAELEPFTEDSPVLAQMKQDFKADGVTLDALSEFGWEAAKVFASVAATIKGPVTRASVNKALLALTNFNTDGMAGSPYSFGPGATHQSNRSVKIVGVRDGKWATVTPNWLTLPAGI